MSRMPWVTYLWPGLPQIWKHGSWLGLAVAVGFAFLLDLALMTSLVWSELTNEGMRIIICTLVALLWMISALAAYGWQCEQVNRQKGSRRQDEYETPFAEGLHYYLQKNWFEAERAFRRLLRRNHRDTDARLMLVSLLRHTERFEEAQIQLERLQLCEGSQKWDLEIEHEQRLLENLRSEMSSAAEATSEQTQSEEEPQTYEGMQETPAEDRLAA